MHASERIHRTRRIHTTGRIHELGRMYAKGRIQNACYRKNTYEYNKTNT